MEGFDNNGVWEEVELLNLDILNYLSTAVGRATSLGEVKLVADRGSAQEDEGGALTRHRVCILRGGAGIHCNVAPTDYQTQQQEEEEEEDVDIEEEGESEEWEEKKGRSKGRTLNRTRKRSSKVDDQFFKLAEMEEFLEEMERERGGKCLALGHYEWTLPHPFLQAHRQ